MAAVESATVQRSFGCNAILLLVVLLLVSTISGTEIASADSQGHKGSNASNGWTNIPTLGELQKRNALGTSLEIIEVTKPIKRPATESCTITLVPRTEFPPSPYTGLYYNNYTGSFTAPNATECGEDWSLVVLDWDASSQGRQYDRFSGLWLGRAELLRTSTAEPTVNGIHWHIEKDVTKLSALFKSDHDVFMELDNSIGGVLSGIFTVEVTLTFYRATNETDAQELPDVVLPIANKEPGHGYWFVLNGGSNGTGNFENLPQNIYRAELEIIASPHLCEEFWYTDPPTGVTTDFGCKSLGAFHEVRAFVDGVIAGAAWPTPVVFTGGFDPYLWHPVVGTGAFLGPSYTLDLTPFVGQLVDGKRHSIAIDVAGDTSYWLVDANLLLWLDPDSNQTSGGVLKHKIETDVVPLASGYDESAKRHDYVSGYVASSKGNLTTVISRSFDFSNSQEYVNFGAQPQIVGWKQLTHVKSKVSTKASGANNALYEFETEETTPFSGQFNPYTGGVTLSKVNRLRTKLKRGDDPEMDSYLVNVQTATDPAFGAATAHVVQQYSVAGGDECYQRMLTTAFGAIATDVESTEGCPQVGAEVV
ncbi:putative Peptide-N4-(N-acetyl-beta-glucosaminyl) asparagine amidase A [Klebsormidium nitens]|uniref:Putative Peptide-N4-(N-acetyl-beta-glucosaminyl) asparagine amidase A n=1 Tax=Klebsormidium nitens TaxID=105231 RepID=A0A1Y1I1X0_KLENI|nr:putative Peptide-N4-(N-acetyl-beta-glucosaminyl) asparagine amidase A [Klebsormidium nitens]|eukprot:GAQ82746.1 putative Peptide-N4-(N-acetyl-beta-glucosaminyl) asparagine amidase A [Klebsormidium nitens]